MRVGAIVVAAGASRRMGGQDKLWLPLGDLPLLGHTLAALAAVAEIDQLVVVSSPDGLRRLAGLRAAQTPQVFRYDLLLEAYEAAGPARSSCTDDAMLLERLGLPVATFPGDPRNIKVSTPADLPLVMLYVHERSRRRGPDTSSL